MHKSEILLAHQAIKIIIRDYNEMVVLTLYNFKTLSRQLFLYVRDKVVQTNADVNSDTVYIPSAMQIKQKSFWRCESIRY